MSSRGRGKSKRGGKSSGASGFYVTQDTAVHIESSPGNSNNSKSYEQAHRAETWDVEPPKGGFASGGIPIGPSKRIQMIVQVANGLLEKRWKRAEDETLIDNMKQVAIQYMATKKPQEKEKLPRQKRIALFTQHGIDLDLLESTEHIHYFAIPVQTSPKDFVETITDSVWNKILAIETRMIQGTPFEKYLQTSIESIKANFEVEDFLQKFYDKIIKDSNYPRDYCYVVGVETKSINSILCGYKKTSLTVFKGGSKPYQKTYWECAREEIATESAVDYGPFATTQYQCRLQKREVPASLSDGALRVYLLVVGNDTGAFVDEKTHTLCFADGLDEILFQMTKQNNTQNEKTNNNNVDLLNEDLKKLQLSS